VDPGRGVKARRAEAGKEGETMNSKKPAPLKCDICGKEYQYPKNFLKHMRRVHGAKKSGGDAKA
jgi:uncharacterized C2H2 Zn-finger protein